MHYLREADFRYHCVAKREIERKKNPQQRQKRPPPTPHTLKKEKTSFIFCRTGSVGRALEQRAEGRCYDHRGQNNTQNLKATEK